jgi:hypothetical protein
VFRLPHNDDHGRAMTVRSCWDLIMKWPLATAFRVGTSRPSPQHLFIPLSLHAFLLFLFVRRLIPMSIASRMFIAPSKTQKKIVSPIPGHMIKHPRSSSHHVPGDRALKLRNKRCVKRSICSRRRHSTCLFTNQHLLPLPRTTHRQLQTLTLDITATAG